MKGTRPQLRAQDFAGAPNLQGPLNDALMGLSLRLDALETVAGLLVLPPVDIKTGGTVTPSVAPFPIRLGVPAGFTPVGLLLLRVEPLTGSPPSNIPSSSCFPWWRPTQADSLELLYVGGLSASTSYRLTLGALRG